VRNSSAKTKLRGDELTGLDVLVVEDNEFQLRIVKVGSCNLILSTLNLNPKPLALNPKP
jgi:hypothetical protein